MSKSKQSKANEPESDSAPSFEESLAELQEIVAELEQGSLGLEESIQRFEKGVSLLRGCYQVLEQAEQRIEILTGTDAEGNPVTVPFDATATFDRSEQSAGKRKQAKRTAESEDVDSNTDHEDDEKTLF